MTPRIFNFRFKVFIENRWHLVTLKDLLSRNDTTRTLFVENNVLSDDYNFNVPVAIGINKFYDNGDEIFDGDIINESGAYIVWDSILSCWCFTFEDSPEQTTPLFHISKSDWKELSYCGNIKSKTEGGSRCCRRWL